MVISLKTKLWINIFLIPAIMLIAGELNKSPALEKSDKQLLVEGNNNFSFALYTQLKNYGSNLFFSPLGISTALSICYAGAEGQTKQQMAQALRLNLGDDKLHPAFSELIKDLHRDAKEVNYQLSIANALWAQSGYPFHEEFLGITDKYYDKGFQELDFINKPEEAQGLINRWVKEKTSNRIQNIIQEPPKTDTRLILTNAIYFKGGWDNKFDDKQTRDESFSLSEEKTITTPMMNQTAAFRYGENEELQLLELPYIGKLSMVIILPRQIEGIKEIETMFNAQNLEEWLSKSFHREVEVSLPKFKIETEYSLIESLKSLGMIDAFSVEKADFSSITPDPVGLFISQILHKAFVEVNEEGTEAAAATMVKMQLRSAEPMSIPVFRADHPFIFMIRDTASESILFIGRIMNPKE